ncbi:MAG: mechanosensitive ion channel family protein [Hyphomonadaceae bacterium]
MQEAAILANVNWPELAEQYSDRLISGALNVIAAAVILIVGLWVAGAASRTVKRVSARHPRIDQTLANFFASIVRYALIAFVIVAVLNRFGVETTSIVAVLGATALAIGLALQGTLSNLAAGVLIIFFRPYRLGDFIEAAGRTGTVARITLFTTELDTIENMRLVLPNGLCWGAPMLNYTSNHKRRADLTFSVAYDADIAQALSVVEQTVLADRRVHREPEPIVKVRALADFSVNILVRYWCNTSDAFDLSLDLNKAIKEALDAAGISIPFPTTMNYEVRVDPQGRPLAAPKGFASVEEQE